MYCRQCTWQWLSLHNGTQLQCAPGFSVYYHCPFAWVAKCTIRQGNKYTQSPPPLSFCKFSVHGLCMCATRLQLMLTTNAESASVSSFTSTLHRVWWSHWVASTAFWLGSYNIETGIHKSICRFTSIHLTFGGINASVVSKHVLNNPQQPMQIIDIRSVIISSNLLRQPGLGLARPRQPIPWRPNVLFFL